MNLIYMVGWVAKEFTDGTTAKGVIKSKRSVGKQYDYFDLVAFKDTADQCRKIKEGSKVSIEGTLQKSKFNETYYYSIVVNDIQLLEKPQPKEPVNTDIQEEPSKVAELKENLKEIVDLQNDNTPVDDNVNNQLDLPDDDLPF